MLAPSTLKIRYRFVFGDGRIREHTVELSASNGRLERSYGQNEQEASVAWVNSWAALEHKKCDHCPLNPKDNPLCPVAKNLAHATDDFKGEKSYEKVSVEVIAPERTYKKDLPLQEGLFGLFGLIMATSTCPYFEFLRPMARFHLPFSTFKETTVRSVSLYLLRQYFVAKKGDAPDYTLDEFKKHYQKLEQVNLGLSRRIRAAAHADVEANSIVILDAFAKLLTVQLGDGLKDLEPIFTVPLTGS